MGVPELGGSGNKKVWKQGSPSKGEGHEFTRAAGSRMGVAL